MQGMALFTLDWNEPFPAECRQGALTIGNFDGVHRGHLALLAEVSRQAQELPGPAVAVCFEPHPLQVLRPKQFQPVLTTTADRSALLQANGADHVVLLRTTMDLLHLSAEEFFNRVIKERLEAMALVEGNNFGFGRGREGTIETLGQLCQRSRIPLSIVPSVMRDGQVVSSSRVRHALLQGKVREATESLGRPYALGSTVGVGQKRGRTIGFPTANLERIETLIPADGVYAVRVEHAGRNWAGAANIGPNPTFGEQTRKVEVHLIEFTGDLLGEVLTVRFLERLRDTKQFNGVDALVGQLRRDVAEARRIVSSGGSAPIR
jgi:riboflavin kinase/FMN adenylyltransferase